MAGDMKLRLPMAAGTSGATALAIATMAMETGGVKNSPSARAAVGAAGFFRPKAGAPSFRLRPGARMRAALIGLLLSAVLGGTGAAYEADGPANWKGADFGDKLAFTVSKVTAQPRVNFVKSPYDDDFTAAACPAATKACRKKSYLVTGDLVLVGRTQGDFTCVSYQSPLAKKQIWANGWLPSAALTPVAPMPSPKTPDWIGNWYHPGGSIEIRSGDGGKLQVQGGMTLLTARDFHNGDFKAQVAPQNDTIAFADDGSNYGEGCQVRMQRIGPWLAVVDNSGCGGAGVSFTGLYRRTNQADR